MSKKNDFYRENEINATRAKKVIRNFEKDRVGNIIIKDGTFVISKLNTTQYNFTNGWILLSQPGTINREGVQGTMALVKSYIPDKYPGYYDESDKENDDEKNEINCNSKINYSDDKSDKEDDNERQKNSYKEIWEKYELQNLCKLINKTQDLQSRIEGNGIKKYLLPGKTIIDKTGKEIIDKNVIKQKIFKQKETNFNKIDIKEKVKSEEENFLKIYTLIKGENELNKKVKKSENNWNTKKKKKKKKKNNITIENVDNKVDNPNDNLHKNNDDYFFIESDCLKFEKGIFLGENITKNYVLHDWKETKYEDFLHTLQTTKIYNQYCDILSTLIYKPSWLFKKKLHDNICEVRLNEKYINLIESLDNFEE